MYLYFTSCVSSFEWSIFSETFYSIEIVPKRGVHFLRHISDKLRCFINVIPCLINRFIFYSQAFPVLILVFPLFLSLSLSLSISPCMFLCLYLSLRLSACLYDSCLFLSRSLYFYLYIPILIIFFFLLHICRPKVSI